MEIDWITVVAQIVNFLILVWLLHRFLYGPVVRAMDRREQRIGERLAEAQRVKEAAEAQGRAYQQQQAELELRKQEIFTTARQEADQAKRDMLRAARSEADARRREWLGQVEAQQQEFLQGLRYRAGEEFFAMARQMLHDMADADLEAHMVGVFLRHLAELEQDARQKLVVAVKEAGSVKIESCFQLAEEGRAELTRGIRDTLATDVDVSYACDPSRPFGIELKAGSQTVLWTFDDYLDQLERNLNQVLAKRPPSPADEDKAVEVQAS